MAYSICHGYNRYIQHEQLLMMSRMSRFVHFDDTKHRTLHFIDSLSFRRSLLSSSSLAVPSQRPSFVSRVVIVFWIACGSSPGYPDQSDLGPSQHQLRLVRSHLTVSPVPLGCIVKWGLRRHGREKHGKKKATKSNSNLKLFEWLIRPVYSVCYRMLLRVASCLNPGVSGLLPLYRS